MSLQVFHNTKISRLQALIKVCLSSLQLGDVFILLICRTEAHHINGCSRQHLVRDEVFQALCVGFRLCPDPTNTLALVTLFILTERLSGAKDTVAGWAVTDTCLQ